MGFNGVSFYTDWALSEVEQDRVFTDSICSLDGFLAAAARAGIHLIARPGPSINAEVAAGGLPGWTLRLRGIIAKAQITNGRPVIMVQPENEYSLWPNLNPTEFPAQFNRDYMAFVEEQLRGAGIVVPFIFNDPLAVGWWAPGTGEGSVDIYGIDAYPSSNPFVIAEFQGGGGTGWGPNSVNQDGCNALVNQESVRVLLKNNYRFGVKLLNIYMTYGGTNWGNLGYEGGASSYEYGAAITENRHVWREKYSEQKLEANFLRVSPAYLTARPGKAENRSVYVPSTAVATTPVFGTNNPRTNFYVVRHADFASLANTTYSLNGDHENTTNDQLGLRTPISLYAGDYGYHAGSLICRGHFSSSGDERSLFPTVSGVSAHGYSVWLKCTFLGSWLGNVNNETYSMTFDILNYSGVNWIALSLRALQPDGARLGSLLGFGFATAGFFDLALNEMAYGTKLIVATGACFFGAAVLGWYLLMAIMFELQELRIPSLPVFDLSERVKAKSLVRAANQAKKARQA